MNQDVLTYLCRSYYLKQHPVLQEKLAYKENYCRALAFPKFAFFKAVSVRHTKMFIQHFERADAVNTVNGREQIVWIIKACFVLQKCSQIKIVFGKHDPYLEAEVFGKGIEMWLNSQGSWISDISIVEL